MKMEQKGLDVGAGGGNSDERGAVHGSGSDSDKGDTPPGGS